MEQILAFVLGAGAVVLIWGVVVAFKTARKVNDVELAITDIYQNMREYDELTNRRIDQEIDRVDRIHLDCIKYTDSRVDKLEAKILSVDKDGCEPTKKILKG
jgi:hypothetical protein